MLRWYWIHYVWAWVPFTARWEERKIAKWYWTEGPGKRPTPEEVARLRELWKERQTNDRG